MKVSDLQAKIDARAAKKGSEEYERIWNMFPFQVGHHRFVGMTLRDFVINNQDTVIGSGEGTTLAKMGIVKPADLRDLVQNFALVCSLAVQLEEKNRLESELIALAETLHDGVIEESC